MLKNENTVTFRPTRRRKHPVNSVFGSFGWGDAHDQPGWSEWDSMSVASHAETMAVMTSAIAPMFHVFSLLLVSAFRFPSHQATILYFAYSNLRFTCNHPPHMRSTTSPVRVRRSSTCCGTVQPWLNNFTRYSHKCPIPFTSTPY